MSLTLQGLRVLWGLAPASVSNGLQAAAARTSLVTPPLVEDLQEDREVASGKGVRASHLATWTTFHFRAAVV